MNATKMVHPSNAILERDWECEMEMEMEMEKWMGLFWTFDFVFNQNKAVFNLKLERTNTRLVTSFL